MAVSAVFGQVLSGIPVRAAAPGAPVVIQSSKNDTSPPLRTLQASPIAPAGKGNQPHRPLHPGQSGTKLPTAGSIQTSAGAAAMPSTSANFEGINNIDGVLPPDTNGDVGPNNYVQWVNLHYQVFDRTGASLVGPSPGNALWSGFGGVCETSNQGDPVVRYDRMANRWVFTQFAFAVNAFNQVVPPFVQCFAVSTTGDPTGTYYRYAWTISNTDFPDYPKLAVWPDGYYMTVNYFSGSTFVGGGALAFDRTKMLNGQAATAISYGPLGAAYGGSLPSDLDGSILPPSGAPNYFGAIDTNVSPSGSTFQIWKFHVDFATPTNSTFGLTSSHTPNFNLPVATYFWNMCNGSRSCIQQPGTRQGLDAISDRLMNRLQYRRFTDGHESLVANHTVGVGSNNNQAAIRWYEIRDLSTTPTIYQQSTYAPSSDSRWMGSIAMDQSGDIALGYSISSSTVSPSIRYTGRLAGDPLASLPQGEATLIAGSGSQTSKFNRWGDYSMMAVDPTDDCTFWYTQEYYAATSTAGWQTRVGSFKFANCAPPLTISAVQASNIDASSVVITWHTSNAANSRVDYGTTGSYGGVVSDPSNVANHSLAVSGLTNDTTYHFKATSTDAFAQTASSSDATFTTHTDLLTNGGFESGSTGWTLAAQATIDANPADAHSGINSLKLVATAAWQGTQQFIPVSVGQAFNVSAWERSSGNGGYVTVATYDSSWHDVGPHLDLVFGAGAGWTSQTQTYVVPSSGTRLVVQAQSSGPGTFWFDDLSVTNASNLINNGGFEAGSVGWYLATQASIDTNPADAHSGNSSLQLTATGPWQGTRQYIPVSPGQTFSVSAWERSTSSSGYVTVTSYDGSWNELGPHLDLTFAGGTSWTSQSQTYVVPSSGVRLVVQAQSSGPGTFWFDDLGLVATDNLVNNGGFEAGVTGWSLAPQASIDTNPTDAHTGNNSLQLVAIGPWQGTQQSIPVSAGQMFTVSAWERSSSGGGYVTITSVDANWRDLGPHLDLVFGAGTSWTSQMQTYVVPNLGVRLVIRAQSSGPGTFWFDDLSLTRQ